MINIQRDGNLNSVWQPALKRINTNDKPYSGIYDVAIIGAGITGLSTALNLQRVGKRCIIIEAANICFGMKDHGIARAMVRDLISKDEYSPVPPERTWRGFRKKNCNN